MHFYNDCARECISASSESFSINLESRFNHLSLQLGTQSVICVFFLGKNISST